MEYRPDIDGLRALAVLLVISGHAWPDYVQNGFVGVDIFFVISGFLITGIVLQQLRAGSFTLREFYIRRVNRIFPALILVLAACIAFGWLSLYASEFKLLGRSAAAGAGFAANIAAYLEGGYWDIAANLKPLLHLWSLGVEEQFYLFWPGLVVAMWSRRFTFLLATCALLAGSLLWNLWSIGTDPSATFYLPFSRLWELLAGGALAYAWLTWDDLFSSHKAWANAAAAAGAAALLATLAYPIPAAEFPGWYAILPVVGTLLIIAAGPAAWLNAGPLSYRWTVYVGLISFPLYLWHWPILTFARILENGQVSTVLLCLALTLTAVLSVVTYHFIEHPIRTGVRWRGPRALALVLLVAAGYLIFANDGLESRYHQASAASASPDWRQIASGSKVALIGDSNAGQFVPVLARLYGAKLAVFATAGWPYLVGAGYTPEVAADPSLKGTPRTTDEAIASILSDAAIDTVIIAHSYLTYVVQDNLRSYPRSPLGETSAQAYEAGLRRTAKLLSEAGKTVIYVKTIPIRFDANPVVACAPAPLPIPRRRPLHCEASATEVQAQRATYDALVARALSALPNVYIFDPVPYLCDTHSCYVQKAGVLQYRDPTHLNESGAETVGLPLAKFVEAKRAALLSRAH